MRLGPDVPSRVTLVLGVPAATGFLVLVSVAYNLAAWTWPFLAAFWLLAEWYIIATATIAFTEVSSSGLTVLTALRYCFIPWSGVTDVGWRNARLNVYTRDRGRFAISQYSRPPLNRVLHFPARQIAGAERLEASIQEARRASIVEPGLGPEGPPWIHLKWRPPIVSWGLRQK